MTELAEIIKNSSEEPTEKIASLIEYRLKNLGSIGLAVIYTIGHILIAITIASFVFNASLNLAALDAFIEPIINGFWFYFLHEIWRKLTKNPNVTVFEKNG